MLISRMDVSGKPSFSFSIRTFFSAQIRPVRRSRALPNRHLHPHKMHHQCFSSLFCSTDKQGQPSARCPAALVGPSRSCNGITCHSRRQQMIYILRLAGRFRA